MSARTGIVLSVSIFLTALGASPAAAWWWAVTTAPIQYDGEELPAGMYVPVHFDGGDFWYSSSYTDANHIPKSSAHLLPFLSPGPPTMGIRDPNCTLYLPGPGHEHPVQSLTPEDWNVGPPHFVRDVQVLYKEGDTFVVRFYGPQNTEQDYWDFTRRIAANCITLKSGKTYSGISLTPMVATPGDIQDKPMSEWGTKEYSHAAYIFGLIAVGLIVGIYVCGSIAYRVSRM